MPAYFLPMTLPLTPQPKHPLEPPTVTARHEIVALKSHVLKAWINKAISCCQNATLMISLGTLDQKLWQFKETSSKTLSVRIDSSFPLETRAQGWDSTPEPESLQAACLRFPGVEPLRAEANNDGPNDEASQTKGIIAPNKETIKAPNGGNRILTISFMSLKTTPAANQESPPGEGTGLRPDPMATTLEQDNQVANLRSFDQRKNSQPGCHFADFQTQVPRSPGPTFPNALMSPSWKISSLEMGYYIDPRTPRSKLIAIFE
ncbi:hypothetical protein DSO57_1012702 [Entomophthora muscae]|uniref:Uncharacterized protein n=1 Tax=Entomophthora muscae TaxID=34485 RepID=A0ACC2SIP6_9FUNG|nr:hypothetical protein DSO57_1012702 [Entomophthora muscae]